MNKFVHICLVLLTILLLLILLSSLRWRIQHDSPIMLYIAYLIHHYDYVPYRDIYDFNTPGAYFAYVLIGIFSGYTDFGCRCIDILILLVILIITWLWMKDFGRTIAWCGCVLWGLIYLGFGPAMSLQREYLIFPLILASLCLSTHAPKLNPKLKYFIIGLLFGTGATMKPQSVIGLPIIFLFNLWDQKKDNLKPKKNSGGDFLFSKLILIIAGFLIPIGIAILYLGIIGALSPFLDMARNYWPLYSNITRNHETMSGYIHIKYLIKEYRTLRGYVLWLAPAALGAYVALYDSSLSPSLKRRVILLAGLTLCYSLYPVLTNKFWYYHMLFYLYFISQLSTLCLVEQTPDSPTAKRWFPVLFFFISLFFMESILPSPLGNLSSPLQYMAEITGKKIPPAPKDGRIDQIALFLNQNLRPDDKVQPLDWTGGAVHAMLITRAKLATPFIYDFYFYHHITNPYIQKLRKTFMLRLKESQPRFIIQITDPGKPWVSGQDTTKEFKELKSFLETYYSIVSQGKGYNIYEIKNSSRTE